MFHVSENLRFKFNLSIICSKCSNMTADKLKMYFYVCLENSRPLILKMLKLVKNNVIIRLYNY